ncbi:MAG: carbohydrate binding family 9 domain-containing protein [Gemmatimonadaceae bacterium]|nr:carbohydrate binding family 9 domain-containing protein [Gemmatimonadaceae bacterium]
MHRTTALGLALGAGLALAAPLHAQSPASSDSTTARRAGRYSADGRREVQAAAAAGSIRIDGVLDEPGWRTAEPATDFVQSEPLTGQPASQATEVRILFDADNLYVGAVLHDTDPSHAVVNDIRKDFREEDQDDFEVLLDTFGDRRNGYVFSTNIEGARHDRQVALEGREINQSWDAVWDVRTKRTANGWTVEMRIPFRALRFDKDGGSSWGINFSRRIRRGNEVVFWSPVPRAYNMNRVSLAGTLTGLQTGSAGRDLRVKPYIADNTVRALGTASAPRPRVVNTMDVGVDVKAALTPGLTMDLTVNPDFGQVEADEQQVNLTQFSQFFPEKRDFFLENSGVFYVGDAARNNRVNPTPTPDEDNLLFFSRRIGLTSGGRAIPILGGIRLTGKLTEQTRLGVLSVQDRAIGTDPGSNASVIRFRQNIGRIGNDFGAFVMQNTHTTGPSYTNRVYGVDKNLRLFGNLDWNSYVVKTSTPGIDSGDYAWRSTLNWEGNFFHGKGGLMQLGPGFQNDLGYYRRTGVRKYLLDTGIRPRSASLRAHGIREFHPHVVWDYQEDIDGHILGKRMHTGWSTFFNNGSVIEWSVNPTFNRLTSPLRPNVKMQQPIPAGGYSWNEHMVYVTSDQSRMFSTNTRLIWGGLYSGTQRTINGSVTFRPNYRFRATVGLQRTEADLELPNEKFTNSLTTVRAAWSFNTNMFIDALSQYDAVSKQFNANVRFNLIHHPLSDLFIVYNDQRILTPDAPVPGRGLILKFTQMFSF